MLTYCVTDSNGRVLLEHNPEQALLPASNIKLFTCAMALESFDADAPPSQKLRVLSTPRQLTIEFKGNLFFSCRYQGRDILSRRIDQLADAIKAHGQTEFESLYITCPTDYLNPLAHYPCVSFVSFNENTLDLEISHGEALSTPLEQREFSLVPDKSLKEQVRKGSRISYNPTQNSLDYWRLEGDNWTPDILLCELRKRGISIKKLSKIADHEAQQLASFQDPVLTSQLLHSSLCHSDNFRAEMLGLHLRYSQQKTDLQQCLQTLSDKIGLTQTFMADGSGLSRDNHTSTRDICRLLNYMSQHRQSPTWMNSLAISGISGTLQNAISYPIAKGKFIGKTGTLRDARALSGYYTNKNGRVFTVSVLQNNEDCSTFSSMLKQILSDIDEK
ncbi:D-alanyl-D-alanine carboxypeptidase [Lentisphaera profundi]|uniref:D-alanyl-D-alanine carboxypeptidase n=1 Tax=Lentisphaera profundi TaxID=1658616 RepID=A0ABY7VZT6_9BACT|nr:D-alanyl-D-alanine carboxypeptidase [Lentisphaera profundi]WDE98382.1 D-alanyl-D-alanine carboxypeptidase [Lentisphaera profundi]